MLRWRLLLGIALTAGLVWLSWLDHNAPVPGAWLLPVGVLITVAATDELSGLVAAGGTRPMGWVVYGTNILLLLAPWGPIFTALAGGQAWDAAVETVGNNPAIASQWVLLTLSAGLIATVLIEIRRFEKPGGATASVAIAAFVMVYIGLMMSFLVQLRLEFGLGALASLVIVVKLGDIGAYTVGRLIGRNKMAPVLSPGKTIEGVFGAFAFAIAGSWAVFAWLLPLLTETETTQRPWWGSLLFGLMVASAGILGDLAESLAKRDVGRKDSSSWIPGFGGVMDLIDSVLLAAPVAYACWLLGIAG
jgi:phosphatidate cytidylyltransferase